MQQFNWSWLGRGLAAVMFAVCMAVVPSGCGDKKPEEPVDEKPAAPPPPTKEQLKSELNNAFKPIADNVAPGAEFEQVMAWVNGFQQAYSKVNGQRTTNPDAELAIGEFKPTIDQEIKFAQSRDRWRFIKGGILCYKVLEAGSKKYDALEKKTDQMMSMPGCKLRGFTQVDADTYAFFEVFDPVSRERKTYRVREGEEFHNGRFQFVRIIGNQEKAEVLYKEAEYTITLGGPRQRVQSDKGLSSSAEQ